MKDKLIWIVQVLLFPFQVLLALFLVIGNEIVHFFWDLTKKQK